ncbi:protein phosphatase inhibitor 2-like [Drosophila tropicalis]|uniref:protein phosphatase inhibitor 2-like n=1 Tax=Drosophila tropicalis TaxID=46794 RepID=UPI0035AB9830
MDQIIRGILKKEQRTDVDKRKIRFDEYNVMETMKLIQRTDNLDTPFTIKDEDQGNLDIPTLMKQLNIASDSAFFNIPEDSEDSSANDDDEFPELIHEKVRRLEFTRRRKMHYKEYFTVPLARQLISKEWNDMNASESEGSGESKKPTTNSQLSPKLYIESFVYALNKHPVNATPGVLIAWSIQVHAYVCKCVYLNASV